MSHPRLFVSIFAYVLGKESEDPRITVREELGLGEHASWPAFRTLARVRSRINPVALSVSHSSLIAKARSMALGSFLQSHAPRWLSLDDDVEAPGEVLDKLLAPTDVDVLIGGCALRTLPRQPPRLNLVANEAAEARDAGEGVRAFPIVYGGLAVSVVTREAALKLATAYSDLHFVDETSGLPGIGVYLERIRDRSWYGEDFAFCERARGAGLRVEALCDATITHAGITACVDPRFFGVASKDEQPV